MPEKNTEKTTMDAFSLDGETITRSFRLQRALSDAETFDEFLTNPKDVAKRHGVTLTEPEVSAARNAGQFLAAWNMICGDGQWMDATLLDRMMGRRWARSPDAPPGARGE